MAGTRESCAKLASEVSSLRQVISSLSARLSTATRPKNNHEPTYAGAVRSLVPQCPNRRGSSDSASIRPLSSKPNDGVQKSSVTQRASDSRPSKSKARERVKVEGARRIWNTVPTCTTRAIAATISKLAGPTKLELRFKRKTKKARNNKTLWWFVVHGNENDLTTLENLWDKIQCQTLWQLQSCFKPLQSASESSDDPMSDPKRVGGGNNTDDNQNKLDDSNTSVTESSTLMATDSQCSPAELSMTNPSDATINSAQKDNDQHVSQAAVHPPQTSDKTLAPGYASTSPSFLDPTRDVHLAT